MDVRESLGTYQAHSFILSKTQRSSRLSDSQLILMERDPDTPDGTGKDDTVSSVPTSMGQATVPQSGSTVGVKGMKFSVVR